MSTAADLQRNAQKLHDDLVTATTVAGVRVATFGAAWRAVSWWTLSAAARRGWPLLPVAGVVVLAFLFPVAAWIVLALVAGLAVVMTTVPAYITLSRSWTLLVNEQRTAVIGFRVWHHQGRVQLILDSHVARRPGSGHGRQLRGLLAGRLAGVLEQHPGTVVRFRARNARLAAVYGAELQAVLPTSQGWGHHLDRADGTARRGA
ncbi:hypothetical protein KIH74_13235 [Kineosporia sp. J2-2]|uniref:DUF304 domain-containing protein n=1 Tax=Kineosporia corallincola TaxID=2835133 RepID=A0ABS5TFM9_9ACTN|nr:hypothetical protein [Kineosporia corallincola]MBT0769894.1 hypothetical protein [Kineosporia corallincola]